MKTKKPSFSSAKMNRSHKIRTVYRKKYPHGRYRYIISLCTEPRTKYSNFLNFIPSSQNEDLIIFCNRSLKGYFKLKYRHTLYVQEKVLTEIFLVGEGDIMMLKMCFPQFIYSIKKIVLRDPIYPIVV